MIEKRCRGGQLQISFGMIFSIIIIIATVATAFYVISHFMNLSRCSDISLFYDSLNKRIDSAWNSPITSDVFTGKLPSGVDYVCFGALNKTAEKSSKEQYDFFKTYGYQDMNVFLYPVAKSCDIGISYYKLKHADTKEFFCIENKGQVKIKIKKDSTDALVQISK